VPSAAAALIVDIRLGDAGVEDQEWDQEPKNRRIMARSYGRSFD